MFNSDKKPYFIVNILFLYVYLIGILLAPKSYARNVISSENICSGDITEVSTKLVNEISDYGNRVIQKSRRGGANSSTMPIYIITAGKPEFEPLPLSNNNFGSDKPSEIEQVFFTTLERHYLSNTRLEETNNYHWLLLTPTDRGWQMVMLLTRFGEVAQSEVVSPPVDTTSGVLGEAVRLWLRDCRYSYMDN
ncbi:MAG: hypothetical protein ACXITR_13830 [Cyanobacterium sp.]